METLLRKYIRDLLTENARKPDDLPDGYGVRVVWKSNIEFEVEYVKGSGDNWESINLPTQGVRGTPYGYIEVKKQTSSGPCDDAFEIIMSRASRGWGPLLYDIAMEVSTNLGGGLMPDRFIVSGDANKVWGIYDQKRSDVKSHQLDDPKNTLTTSTSDNCSQESSQMYLGSEWQKSPLSKRYTKEPATINALKSAGKISFVREGDGTDQEQG